MLSNNASVSVTITPSELVPIITGGNRMAGNEEDLILNGTLSYDPDSPSTVLTYTWICTDVLTNLPSCNANQASAPIANGNLSIVAKSQLVPKTTIRMMLVITDDRTNRRANTSVEFKIVLGNPPQTLILPIDKTKVNTQDKLVLRGMVSSKIDPSPGVKWLLKGDSEDQAGAKSIFGLPTTSSKMVLLPNSLGAGNQYTFVLQGTDMFGQSSQAEINIVVNNAPTSPWNVSIHVSSLV